MFLSKRLSIGPLSIAAYVTWAAVSYAVWQEAPASRNTAAMLLLIFLVATVINQSTSASSAFRRRNVVTLTLFSQVAATFCLFGLGVQSTSPVLLIIIAAEVMLQLQPRVAWTLLLFINAAFYAVLVVEWKADNPLFVWSLYGGFQAFAALTAGSMKKAQVAADSLRLANAELLSTRALLAESARDGERLRVSRELHDVAGHKLTALSLNLELLRTDADVTPRRELNLAYELSREILSDIRAVVSKLRHHDGIDLQEALARLISMFPAPRVSLHLQAGLRVAGTERAEALLRCAQEALSNAARHAGAAQAYVSLTENSEHVILRVEDDGKFEGPLEFGNGLTGLTERLESINGSIVIDRGSYGGCRLTARIPRHGQQ